MKLLGIEPAVWLPLVSLVLGLLLKAFFDFLSDGRLRRREGIARREQRQDAARLRRIEFQRATLLALQDNLLLLARCAGQAHIELAKATKQGTPFREAKLSAELDQRFADSQRAVALHLERVESKEVRSLVKAATADIADGLMGEKADAGFALIERGTLAFATANELIGHTLRALDAAEDSALEKVYHSAMH